MKNRKIDWCSVNYAFLASWLCKNDRILGQIRPKQRYNCIVNLDTDQVSSLSDEYNLKRHFVKTRGQIFTKIWSALYWLLTQRLVSWKILILHVKVYTLNLFFVKKKCPRLKACAKTNSSKNAKNRQNAKNREFEPRIQDN